MNESHDPFLFAQTSVRPARVFIFHFFFQALHALSYLRNLSRRQDSFYVSRPIRGLAFFSYEISSCLENNLFYFEAEALLS